MIQVWAHEKDTVLGVCRYVSVESLVDTSIYYEIEAQHPPKLSNLNFALCATLFEAMRLGRGLHIHGPVSRRLLINLEEFQAAQVSWFPKELKVVDINVDKEIDDAPAAAPAIVAFSGGLDGCFSYYRHTRGLIKYPEKIGAIMMVHGFDIPVSNERAALVARKSVEKILDHEDVNRVWIKTNLRECGILGKYKTYKMVANSWVRTFGAGVASCFHQFDSEYSAGIIASDYPYSALVFPHGRNPVTNPLLSSGAMRITYDGASVTRVERVDTIKDWAQAVGNLRVCFKEPLGVNCCKCQKCIRTILEFWACGLKAPKCFPTLPKRGDILDISLPSADQRDYFVDLISKAQMGGVNGWWLKEAKKIVTEFNLKSNT